MTTRHPLRSGDLNPHDPTKMHIHKSGLGGINRVAATSRISAVAADHEGEVDAGTWLYRSQAVVFFSSPYMVLVGIYSRPDSQRLRNIN